MKSNAEQNRTWGLSGTRKYIYITKNVLSYLFFYGFVFIFLCVLLFPFFVMLSKSLMTAQESIDSHTYIPARIQWANYAVIFQLKYLCALGNSVFLAVINMTVGPFMAAFTAFGFARMRFKLKKFFFVFIMSTLMLPALITQIPTYVLYAKIGLLNSLTPLYISTFFGGGVINIFLIIQFMRSIPKDIDNAAILDGAGYFRIFFSLILPLCKPVLLYLSINIFSGVWNDIQNPLIYLSSADASKYTLNYLFFFDFGRGGALELLKNQQMALGVLMTLPPVVIFLIFQKQLLEGIVMTAVKG